MMAKPLVFDSTPLIYLTKVSLSSFFSCISAEKFTTKAVFDEVVKEGKRKDAPEASLLERLFNEHTISVRALQDKEFLKFVKEMAAQTQRHPLHEAEAEVLCLAKELNGVAIADDKAVRTVAGLLGIETHGTAYILGKIYAAKKITKEELLKKVREMRELGWRLSAEDYFKITAYLNSL
jgi:predicted nucleic acid-binding protein